MADIDLTPARLREVLSYDPDTGIFTRNFSTSTRVRPGDVAGGVGSSGYINIKIGKVHFLGHRLAWLYVNGFWPERRIDHINGVLTDNRMSNLRQASASENQQNCKVRSDSSSGYTGVSFNKASGKWQAQIAINNKLNYLGVFNSPELANVAYKAAKEKLHVFQPFQRSMKQ